MTQLTAVFTGGTGSVDNDIGAVTSGTAVPTGVLFANTTFTLTVTNPAGDTASKQTTVATSALVGPATFTATGSMTVPRSKSHGDTTAGRESADGGRWPSCRESCTIRQAARCAPTEALGGIQVDGTSTLLQNGRFFIAGGYPLTGPLFLGCSPVQPQVPEPSQPRATWSSRGSPILRRSCSIGRVLVAGGGGASNAYLATAEVYNPTRGTFTPTGQMSHPRTYFTANLLPDGQVLVAGGMNVTSIPPRGYVATADLWNPTTGLFTPTGSLFYGRCSHTAMLLVSGRVLIVGGEGQGGPTLRSETYDSGAASFSTSAWMGSERYRHATTLLPNGNVLVTGGYFSTDGELATSETYEQASGSFTPGRTTTMGRALRTATLLPSGRVLLAGGIIAEGGPATSTAELHW